MTARKRAELMGLARPAFRRAGPWLQAGKYVTAVISDLPRRNGWTIARFAGDRSPDRTQRLLNRAAWDEAAVTGVVRRFAVAGLDQAAARRRGRRLLAVGALDETVHLSYVREGTGHALISARQWIPAEQVADPVASLVMRLPLEP